MSHLEAQMWFMENSGPDQTIVSLNRRMASGLVCADKSHIKHKKTQEKNEEDIKA
jgi:hypothetical protein